MPEPQDIAAPNPAAEGLDALAREMGLAGDVERDETPDPAGLPPEAPETPSGRPEPMSAATAADFLIARGRPDLAQAMSPSELEGWRGFLHDLPEGEVREDMNTVAVYLEDGGYHAPAIKTMARLHEAAAAGPIEPRDTAEYRSWVGSDGALTEAATAWLASDDEGATVVRELWGDEASVRFASVMAVVHSGLIPVPVVQAFCHASQDERHAALRLLHNVATRAKERRA